MTFTISQVMDNLRNQANENPEEFSQFNVSTMLADAFYYLRTCGLEDAPANILMMAKLGNDLVNRNTWTGFEALAFQGLIVMSWLAMQAQEMLNQVGNNAD
jgi:uncharacterized membrane protein